MTARVVLIVAGALILAFLALPTLVVIPMSLSGSAFLQFPPESFSWRWYEAYIGSIEWHEATMVSVKVGATTAVLATVLGTLAAYGLAQTQSRGIIVRFLFLAPLLVPIILIAIGVFFLFARLGINNTIMGLVLAHTALAMPFVVIIMLAALSQFDFAQERAARSLGANRLRAFLSVTLPQVKVSILSSALFAFLTSFDEVVIALFISGGDNTTLTRRMFNSLRDEIDPTIAAISTLLIAITVVVMSANVWISAKRVQT